MKQQKKFCCYFYFVGWDCLSLGAHLCPTMPNLEVHVPFGFVRIGWCWVWPERVYDRRTFGYEPLAGKAAGK
jgi:hypothetical protein